MYPYIRALAVIAKARKMPKLGLYEPHISTHRAWPWDTDLFGELNHGRILTLLELDRWAAATRIGILGHVIKDKLMFPVAGVSIRYRKRIPTWQTYRVQTRFLGYDDRFTYAEQSMWQGETCMNQLLLRAAIKDKNGTIKPRNFLEQHGYDIEQPAMPEWAQNWIDAEATRPWPPEDGPIYDN
ncbi:MAG: acyl-CoA thioesterase [Boseongicola sp.]|nr:acyl-CoA thioesterase [Boseongicola sp.]